MLAAGRKNLNRRSDREGGLDRRCLVEEPPGTAVEGGKINAIVELMDVSNRPLGVFHPVADELSATGYAKPTVAFFEGIATGIGGQN